ncbi:MAG: serine hydrolase [Fuerstiella sp.]
MSSFSMRTLLFALVLLSIDGQTSADEPIQVAVFKGEGVGSSVNALIDSLGGSNSENFAIRRISADEIRSGKLANVDVLIHPGGSGSRQGKALGEEGREAVTTFVDDGGGFLGVCAGAYLATNDYSWSLNLIDAKAVDRRHWARGKGTVELKLSTEGASFFGHVGEEMEIYYGQGPLLGRPEWDDKDVPDYQSLAIYKTGLAEKGAPAGVMPGTSAIVRAHYGDGRVFCFSPHPEMTKGRGAMIGHAVNWLSPVKDPEAVELVGIREIVERTVPTNGVGGVGVLVTQNGVVQHQKGYGFINGRRVTARTPLRLASITKQYAAMCAAILIEEGKLDLEEKVSHYLPDLNLPVKGRELQIKDLMWHTSGLANFIQTKEKAAIKQFRKDYELPYLTNETHAKWLTTMDVRRAPGTKWEYTNSGYTLLTRIVEVIANEPFHEFQQRRIFDVLQLTSTTDSQRFNGSGNMVTTLIDYAKWDKALWDQDPRLISKAGYRMIFTQGNLDNGAPVEYGLGWRVVCNEGKLVVAEHGGAGSGTTAARNWIRRHFKDGTTVAFFAQEIPDLNRDARQVFSSQLYEAVLKARSSAQKTN